MAPILRRGRLGCNKSTIEVLLLGSLATVTLQQGISHFARFTGTPDIVSDTKSSANIPSPSPQIDVKWYPCKSNPVNTLDDVFSPSSGTYGFYFDGSDLPSGTPYGTYNYANMPRVRANEYPLPDKQYTLEYVEVIHRHHKRTPYAHNSFPREAYPWDCDDEALVWRAAPKARSTNQDVNRTADTYLSVYESASNPFARPGYNGTCQFPQLTRRGLDDCWQHGRDLHSVYAEKLNSFIPSTYDPSMTVFRVTTNIITSQVAGMLISGLYPDTTSTDTGLRVPLIVQPAHVDSLEYQYPCEGSTRLYETFVRENRDSHSEWTEHMSRSHALMVELDAISGVDPDDKEWHIDWDHYFDSVSMRLGHGKPLPCSITEPTRCVTRDMAEQVLRLGMWEYSWMFRDAGPKTLHAAVAEFGVWMAELVDNFRRVTKSRDNNDDKGEKYRHNVAHDGSLARMFAILQIEEMVWPGMGAEVIFEIYSKQTTTSFTSLHQKEWFLRVLWGGKIFRSSSPTLGVMVMVPLDTFVAYIDELVGEGASKIPFKCRSAETAMSEGETVT